MRGNSHGTILQYYQEQCAGGTEENNEKLDQDTDCPGRDSNSGPSENETQKRHFFSQHAGPHTVTDAVDLTFPPVTRVPYPVLMLTPKRPPSRIDKVYLDVMKGTTPYRTFYFIRGIHSPSTLTAHTDMA